MKATKKQIARLDRLKKRSDFLHVQKAGKRWVSKGMILQAVSRAPAPDALAGDIPESHPRAPDPAAIRFGLTASRKLSRKAVERNRVRRRLRAAARDVLPDTAQEGADYVLIGRTETATRPYDELCRDLRWCLRRLEMSREPSGGEKL